jgi:ankyrin repeat protein
MKQMIRAAVLVLATLGQAWAGELFDATSKGDAAAVDRLLSSGAAVDEPGRNAETPLIIAALNDRQDISALLLAYGADVQARNAGGFTPLHAAAYSGSISVASLLLAKGAVLDDTSNKAHASPLMVAADEGRAEVAELFIVRGADLNTRDKDGFSLLTNAWQKKHVDVVRLLKRHGATCQSVEVLGSEAYHQQCVDAGDAGQ